MGAFARTRTGRVVLRIEAVERQVLIDLMTNLLSFVAPAAGDPDADPLAAIVGIDPQARRPDDPVLLRLLPDAYPDDDEAAADFRRYTERSLRSAKAAHASTVLTTLERSGEKITLSSDEASSWLLALNDVRLALGVRIESETEPVVHDVYDWLTYLQGTLVEALDVE